MKNKILGLPKAAVIVIGIVITALFLVLMNLVGGVVAHLTSIYRQLHVTADRRDRCSNLCNRYAVSYGISAVA